MIHYNTKFCVKCKENQTSRCVPQTRGVHQVCGWSPYVFKCLYKRYTECTDVERTYSPVNKWNWNYYLQKYMLEHLFLSCVNKKIEILDKYCKLWKLKCYLNKPKIIALKKVRKLKKTENWRMNGWNKEAVNTFSYLVSHWKSKEVGTNKK